jgi:phage terminase large subunit GpA-like protein
MRVPLVVSRHEVTTTGKANKYGLELVRLDTDHWKSWVHERVRWPGDQPGAWHLPHDIPDDYCMQIVSEARARTPSGKPKWVQRSRENHFLDCEAMQAAAGYLLNMQRMTPDFAARLIGQRKPAASRVESETVAPAVAAQAHVRATKPTLKGLAQLNRPRL